MTDAFIEQTLIDYFLTLNEFSGVQYIKYDGNGQLLNVGLPNRAFTMPQDKRCFLLTYLPSGAPEPMGLGTNAENQWRGLLQIDIITPIGTGLDEPNAKYAAIAALFERGKNINGVTIRRAYRAMQEAEEAFFRTILRVEVSASLPK